MQSLIELPPLFVIGVAVALGLVFGSFLNVVIHRLPRGQSVVWPGSHCPACGKPIAGYDNLPVLSYLLLLGRARCCKERISVRYPLVEAMSGLYAYALVETVIAALPDQTTILAAFGVFAVSLALGLMLLAAAFIDLEHMLLPDRLTLGAVVLGLISVPLRPDANFVHAVLGGTVGFLLVYLPFDLLYRWLRGRTGMALGDAKLLAAAGVWFGWQGAVFALMAGAVQGTVVALSILLVKGRLDEPAAIREERQKLEEELLSAEPEARDQLLREIAKDPVLAEPPPTKLGSTRFAFGPFLVIAILELQLFGEPIRELLHVLYGWS